ncbi:MAG TPA: hypothetical protein VLB44_13740 [Kofleriaceae bacterium]|nr:hypothetical protein [Kofleriaceae bacterium]
MVRAAVALLVSVAVMSAGCFPHNAARRQQAKYAEGASLVAGILVSALSNTGADCDSMAMQGIDPTSCRTKAKVLGTVGLTLILAGLLGFVATVSTAEDDNDAKPVTTIVPDTKGKPGATAGSAAAPPPTTPPPATTPTTTATTPTDTGATDATAGSGAGSATTPPTP